MPSTSKVVTLSRSTPIGEIWVTLPSKARSLNVSTVMRDGSRSRESGIATKSSPPKFRAWPRPKKSPRMSEKSAKSLVSRLPVLMGSGGVDNPQLADGRMVAINSALSIDLTGQVSADSIGTRFYSGVGGQMDFMRGAALADEGRAIIALPATAAGGAISMISCGTNISFGASW